jgi:hypothetical protein
VPLADMTLAGVTCVGRLRSVAVGDIFTQIASYGGITFAQCVGYCAKSCACLRWHRCLIRLRSPAAACGAAVSVGSTSSVNCYLKAGTDSRNLRAVTSYIETGLVGNCASLSGQAPASANAVCTNMSSMSPSAVTRRRKRDEQQCARQGFARCPIPGQMGDTECVDLANSNESWCVPTYAACCASLKVSTAAPATCPARLRRSRMRIIPAVQLAGASSVRHAQLAYLLRGT